MITSNYNNTLFIRYLNNKQITFFSCSSLKPSRKLTESGITFLNYNQCIFLEAVPTLVMTNTAYIPWTNLFLTHYFSSFSDLAAIAQEVLRNCIATETAFSSVAYPETYDEASRSDSFQAFFLHVHRHHGKPLWIREPSRPHTPSRSPLPSACRYCLSFRRNQRGFLLLCLI